MSNKDYSLSDLRSVAEKYTPVEAIATKTGTVLISEYGARVLGLFPSNDLANTLWNHKSLDTIFSEKNWQVGGERLWIAPEQHYYYENPRDFDGFHVPAGIDPGSYVQTSSLTYENSFSLLDLASNEVFDNSVMRRHFASLADPYKTGLSYAGVAINDSITVPSGAYHRFCAWSLTQICASGHRAGTAFFPIKPRAKVLNYFDPIPADRFEVKGGCCKFKMDAAAVYKLAIAPEDMDFDNPCKAVFVSPFSKGDQWMAVVKRSDQLPRSQEECVDVAKNPGETRKGAIQSYNCPKSSDPLVGGFGEIEMQLRVAVKSGSKSVSSSAHELLAYAGTKDEILHLAKTALGVKETPTLY